MYKVIFVIFYFNSFPNYFPFFLDSCKENPDITWKIYTDNQKTANWPSNVEYCHMTFQQCKKLFQSRFPLEICLPNPKKLCDYKPAYGYILEEQLRQYDFWGYCDVDMIFGDLRRVLAGSLFDNYDKLFTLGHMTLYRNIPACNRYFMTYDGGKRYREVFRSDAVIGFDEWSTGNINEIFRRSEFRFYDKYIGADIWPERTRFYLSEYDKQRDRYKPIAGSDGIFLKHRKGLCLIRNNGEEIEYPCVHLQKRSFDIKCEKGSRGYYIVPGSFESLNIGRERALQIGRTRNIIDRQFIKIKLINLRRKLRLDQKVV